MDISWNVLADHTPSRAPLNFLPVKPELDLQRGDGERMERILRAPVARVS